MKAKTEREVAVDVVTALTGLDYLKVTGWYGSRIQVRDDQGTQWTLDVSSAARQVFQRPGLQPGNPPEGRWWEKPAAAVKHPPRPRTAAACRSASAAAAAMTGSRAAATCAH
jgi:hypothetical protein